MKGTKKLDKVVEVKTDVKVEAKDTVDTSVSLVVFDRHIHIGSKSYDKLSKVVFPDLQVMRVDGNLLRIVLSNSVNMLVPMSNVNYIVV